jgi:hypothetical protein
MNMAGQYANHKDSSIEWNVSYEETAVVMNKYVGDDHVGVEKSPKKNEK